MKNNLDRTIEKFGAGKKTGIMAHLVTGYPTLALSKKIAQSLVAGGADIIEIQVPFSDPMADGPLIVEACQKSLDNGTKVKDSFALAAFVDKTLKTPVVLMTYANIVIHMGIEKFCDECKKHKISGVIVPDLPHDSKEGEELKKQATRKGIHLIYVLSPAIEKERLEKISRQATGFLYCTSRQGTTGTGKRFASDLHSYLKRVKKSSHLPLAVGFGISSHKDIKEIKPEGDIAVIGSAVIDLIQKTPTQNILKTIEKFVVRLNQ
ncbi:MAG: tryptophan synthase subunit alpha [Candidatus Pacebacteria bacterium]|nr:tryptophan synthase subunit alpha [Candidatus Paceibacterota bacterium]MDD5357134.1 tryptophan synthase subunit alpha [Candidatus Paceibacterota bacterium]